MSESDDSKQRSEVDETQRQQDEEKIRTEGGPRLNGRLAAATVGIMMVTGGAADAGRAVIGSAAECAVRRGES